MFYLTIVKKKHDVTVTLGWQESKGQEFALIQLIYFIYLYRGSYMTARVLLTLLNDLGKSDQMWSLSSI